MDYFFFSAFPAVSASGVGERQKNLIRRRRRVATSLAHLYRGLPGLPVFTLNLNPNILEKRENHLCW